jgi:D-glycero-alpha-D-manno-heptose 1-phosphate guanylyltransferase
MHKDCIILTENFDEEDDTTLFCLQEMNGKAFLYYIAQHLKKYHICKVVFALGKNGHLVKQHIKEQAADYNFAFDFAEDNQTLGSGGAIMNALQYSDTTDIILVNAYEFIAANIDDLVAWQQTKCGDLTMCVVHSENVGEQWQYHINEESKIFEASRLAKKSGLISTGLYCLFRPSFLNINFPPKFSFQKDYIHKHLQDRDVIGMISEDYYCDIRNSEHIIEASEKLATIFPTYVTNK